MPIPPRHPGLHPTDPPPSPGRLVRHAREQAYLSQEELARRAGVSRTVLARLERGTRPPRWELVQQLLACLDLQPRVHLETLDSHLAAQLQQEATRPALEWLLDAVTDIGPALRLAHTAGLVVDGSLAARLHGVALPVGDIELLVPPTCSRATLEVTASTHWISLRHDDGRAGDDPDDDDGDDGATWWADRFERRIVVRRTSTPPPVALLVPPSLDEAMPTTAGAVQVAALDHLRLDADGERLLHFAVRRRHAE